MFNKQKDSMKRSFLLIVFSIISLFSLYSYIDDNEGLSNEDLWVMDTFSKMTLDERIGQFFFVDVKAFSKNRKQKEVLEHVSNNKVGGILFRSPELDFVETFLTKVKTQNQLPMFVGVDKTVESFDSFNPEMNFPSNLTLSIANDKKIAQNIGELKADFYRRIGVNVDFSIEANLALPNVAIKEESFGDVPLPVSRLISGTIKGFLSQGVSVAVKDFPGVSSQLLDSNNNYSLDERIKSLNAVNLLPFREAIKANVPFMIMGNVVVRSIDSLGLPMSLSKSAVSFLRNELSYKGFIVADGSDVRGLKNFCDPNKFALESFKAGCNIFIGIDDIAKSVKDFELSVLNGEIDLEEVNRRCIDVLRFKYRSIVKPKKHSSISKDKREYYQKIAYEKGTIVLKNEDNKLAIRDLTKKYAHISIGPFGFAFDKGIDRFKKMDHLHFYSVEEAKENIKEELKDVDHFILTLHENYYHNSDKSILNENWNSLFEDLDSSIVKTVIAFTSPLNLKKELNLSKVDAFVLSFENNKFSQERLSQLVGGATSSDGTLSFTISEQFKRGFGVKVETGGRLKYSNLDELGIDSLVLSEIDSIVLKSIDDKVFPGCQVFAAVNGSVMYNKSFGTPIYEDTIPVNNFNLYDIASVTKVAASTIALMRLETQGKIDMNKHIGEYIPELVIGSSMSTIYLKDMMTHQAGLPSWIPFYYKTIHKGKLDSTLYSKIKKENFETKVADSIWILNDYTDTIYKRIKSCKLKEKTYKYSDLGYYFVKKIVEKVTGIPFNVYLKDSIYLPMGLSNITYKPLDFFPLEQIIPTEQDEVFRNQLVWGYVHDPGAAMLGGVGGHAGLFANATDLGSLMQMVLNKGKYGNIQFIDSAVVEKYTSCQFCETNRRGLGFDRPKKNGGGTCDKVASSSSFGHSGFTGTLVWCDPKYQINYVFLSNRVHPSADNWKIVEQNVRTNIQKIIYDAVGDSKTRLK